MGAIAPCPPNTPLVNVDTVNNLYTSVKLSRYRYSDRKSVNPLKSYLHDSEFIQVYT